MALGDTEGHGRARSARVLAQKVDKRSLWALVPLLQDSFFLARREAALALKKLDWQPKSDKGRIAFLIALEEWSEVIDLGAKAVPYLVKLLCEKHEPTAKAIVSTLQKIGEPAIRPLCRIATGSDEKASKRALKLLVELHDERAIPAFLVNLESARVSLRLVALRGLNKVVSAKCKEPLIGLLENEREASVLRSLYSVLAHHNFMFEDTLKGLLKSKKGSGFLAERCFRVFEAMGEKGRSHLEELSNGNFEERAKAALETLDRVASGSAILID